MSLTTSGTETRLPGASEIRPLRIEIPEKAIDDLFTTEVRAAFRSLRTNGGPS